MSKTFTRTLSSEWAFSGMLKNLTKKQVHTLLDLLDTLSSIGISPGYTIIWDLRPRTVFDMYRAIGHPNGLFDVSVREELGSLDKIVIDIAEEQQ